MIQQPSHPGTCQVTYFLAFQPIPSLDQESGITLGCRRKSVTELLAGSTRGAGYGVSTAFVRPQNRLVPRFILCHIEGRLELRAGLAFALPHCGHFQLPENQEPRLASPARGDRIFPDESARCPVTVAQPPIKTRHNTTTHHARNTIIGLSPTRTQHTTSGVLQNHPSTSRSVTQHREIAVAMGKIG